MLAKHFGLRLKYLRKIRKLTQAQLAQAVDISVTYLGRVERGLSSPSFEVIQKVSEALETEPANLFLPPGRGSADTRNHIAEGAASSLTAPFSCTWWTRFGALLWELPEGDEHWSREFWQLLGYGDRARKTASTELLLQHVCQEHRSRVAAALRHAHRGNPVNDLEFLLERKDGECRDIVLHIDVVKDPRGTPRSLHGTAMDLTEWRQLHAMLMVNQKELEAYVQERTTDLALTVAELKREMAARDWAEAALRDLSRLMRGMADNLPDLVWAKDLEGRYLFVNQAICDMLLKAEDTQEPLGKTDLFFAQRERAAGHEHTFGEVCANSDEVTLRTLEPGRFLEDGLVRGRYLALDVHKAPFYDAGGTLIGSVGAGRDVTADLAAREQAEAALRESEERFRLLFMKAPLPYQSLDAQGNFLEINQVFLEVLGYSREEVIGRNFGEFLHPDHVAHFKTNFPRFKAVGEVLGVEFEMVKKDGSTILVSFHGKIQSDTQGRFQRTHCIFQDITERKRLEQALLYKDSVIRSSASAIATCDLQGNMTYGNPCFISLWGFTKPEEFLGKPFTQFWLLGERYQEIMTALRAGRAWVGELKATRKDGSQFDTQITASLVVDSAGNPVAFTSTSVDITERRRLEQALRESEERLKSILGTMPDFVSIIDREYALVWANSACFETFGQDILNRPCFEVFNGCKGEPCPDCVGRTTFENGRPNTLERAVHLPDGSQRFFSWMSAPLVRDEDGSVTRILHMGRDITDFRQAIVDLEQAKSDAEAATRAKSHFLAAMSHDLRTPLNGALGMLQLLQATGLEPEQNEYLDYAILAARNLLTLINEILDLAKVEAGRMEVLEHEFSPRAFLETELRVLKAQAELKGLRFVLEVEPDVPQAVLTDQIRLGQILQNLVGNALKFTHQGELRVSCAALPGEDDACTLRFCVADTGPGISENLRDKLFTPFVQGQEGQTAVKGSGLGLSIVKRLVELLGGDIEVHSAPEKGARFIFTIRAKVSPLARQLASAQATVAATMATATVAATVELDAPREEHAAPSHKRKVVLVVEDDDINRLAAERMLRSLGHAVLAVSDGAKALDILREREVDLVLMDVRLPLLDGLAATRAIRSGAGGEKNAKIPIVALTALAMDGDRKRCLEAGMDEYLAKPVEIPALRQALERFLGPEREKPARKAPAPPAEHADD